MPRLLDAADVLLLPSLCEGLPGAVLEACAAGEDGVLTYRPVQTGPAVGALRVVDEGLEASDAIVVNGLMRVRPGAVIQPMPVDMARAAAGDYTPVNATTVAATE